MNKETRPESDATTPKMRNAKKALEYGTFCDDATSQRQTWSNEASPMPRPFGVSGREFATSVTGTASI